MSTQTTKQTNERTNEWISHRSINEQIKKVDIFYFQHGHGNDVLAMMNHDKPPFKFGHLLKPKRRFPSKLSSLHWQPTSWRWAEWHPAKHRTHHRGELHTHTTSWHPHMLHTDILTQTRTMMDHVIHVYTHANTHLFIYIYILLHSETEILCKIKCLFFLAKPSQTPNLSQDPCGATIPLTVSYEDSVTTCIIVNIFLRDGLVNNQLASQNSSCLKTDCCLLGAYVQGLLGQPVPNALSLSPAPSRNFAELSLKYPCILIHDKW